MSKESDLIRWAREIGEPQKQAGESATDFQIRIAERLVRFGKAARLASEVLHTHTGRPQSDVFHEAVRNQVRIRATMRGLGWSSFTYGMERDAAARLLASAGFVQCIREAFSAPHCYPESPDTIAHYELWARPEEGLAFKLLTWIDPDGKAVLQGDSMLYASVESYLSGTHPSGWGIDVATAPPWTRAVVRDDERLQPFDDVCRYGADSTGVYPSIYVVRADQCMGFLADVRSSQQCEFRRSWGPDGKFSLREVFNDYAYPLASDAISFNSDPWVEAWDELSESQKSLYRKAAALGIDLQDFQAGRRLCMLPHSISCVFLGRPEAAVLMEAYRSGVRAGLREPTGYHAPLRDGRPANAKPA